MKIDNYHVRVTVDSSIKDTGEILLDIEGIGDLGLDQWIIMPMSKDETLALITSLYRCVWDLTDV